MIRRFAVLTGLLAVGVSAAYGQSLTPTVLNESCATTPGAISCGIVGSALPPTTITVSSPPEASFSGWSLSTGNTPPPPGVSIDPLMGVISGTPTASGHYVFNVVATYASTPTPITVSQLYAINVYAPSQQLITITSQPTSLPGGTVGTAIPTAAYTASAGVPFIDVNGNQSYQWAIDSASAAEGLSINGTTTSPTATLSGTPVSPGTYSIIITATDATGGHAQAAPVSLTVTGNGTYTIGITTTTLPSGVINVPYSQALQETGGPSTGVVWSVSQGTLPAGLQISSNTDSSGTISGTPTAVGTSNFTVQAAYPGSTPATQALSITITSVAAPLTMANPAAVTGVVGTTVTMQFSASGGVAPYTYSLTSGTPPAGLQLNTSTGAVTGTATAAGTATLTVLVTDSASHTASATGTITVNAATSLSMANPAAVTGVVGTTVTMQFTGTGGVAPYTYSLVSGTLPAGLQLNTSTGAITGTATAAGSATITVQVADSASHTAQATGTITVNAALTVPTPATVTGYVGESLSPWMQFTATGGTAPYTYTVSAGSLPTGLTLNASTGAITGQATQSGNFSFLVQVTDSSSPVQTATSSSQTPATINISLLTITGAISLTNSSGVAITPGGAVTAGTQPTVTINLGTAAPEQITGTVSVTFTRLFDTQSSKEVLFSTGLPFVNFTIAAGSTQATFPNGALALLVGTSAGFGQVTVSFQDALGNSLPSPTVQTFTFSIAGTPPVIKAFTLSCSGTTYTANVIGYSTTLDMTNAVFNFTPTSNATLTSSSATVSLGPLFLSWFSSSPSNQYGGQFMLTVPFAFSVSGGSTTNPVAAMTVTLTNSKGTSTVSSPANPSPACQ